MLKTLITVSTVLLTTAAFAQVNTKSPGSSEYAPGQKMQKSKTSTAPGASEYAPGHQKNTAKGPGHSEKRAGSADHRIGCEEEVLVLQWRGPASTPGRLACGCPQVRPGPFYRSSASLAQCDASLHRFTAAKPLLCPAGDDHI